MRERGVRERGVREETLGSSDTQASVLTADTQPSVLITPNRAHNRHINTQEQRETED